MSTTLEVVQSILAALGDSTIPIESLTSTAIALSLQCIANANDTDKTHRRDTAGVDSFFWALWDGVYKLAEEGDEGVQERLVTFLKDAKASEAGEQWVVRDVKGGWNTLPLLGDVAKDIWNVPNIPPTVSDTSQIVRDILAGDAPKPSSAPDLLKPARDISTCNASRFGSGTRVLALDIVHLGLEVSEGARELDLDISMVSMTSEPGTPDDTDDDSLREHVITLDEVDQASDGGSDDEDYDPNDDLINDLSLDLEDDNDRIKTPCALEVEAAAIWMTIAADDMLRLVNNDAEGTSRWPGWKAASWKTRKCKERRSYLLLRPPSGRWMRQMEIVWTCDISFPIPVLG
ncbi:hypothetical protein BU17DRAFT_68712 [Hysterangium stoloniferum]|nr:hypothetical protein BU17DRAFT_68712 [Hysterangium stoloniferum]